MIKSSKLGQLLLQLPVKEHKEVRKFLQSPFFNRRDDLLQLFEHLLSVIPVNGLNCTNEEVFEAVFGPVPYDPTRFHLHMSYLFRLLEEYLAIRSFQEDAVGTRLRLLRAYRERGLAEHRKQALRQTRKVLQKSPYRDADHFDFQSALSWESYQLQLGHQPSEVWPLEEWVDLTDRSFFTHKLKQLCVLAAHQAVYTANYQYIREFRNAFFPYLESRDLLQVPAIGLYYHGFFILQDEAGDRHFPAFRELLREHSDRFSEEVRQLYLMAINYCVGRVNRGEHRFFEEMSALYRAGLSQNLLLEKGRLSRFTYLNAVAAAIQTRDFDWAEELIEQYRRFLSPAHRDSAYHYCRARLSYETGRYDEALTEINQAYFKDVLLNLAAKTISLKIYYTLENFDLLDAHVNAMNNFIRRNRLIGYHRKNYLNLLRFTRKLLGVNPFDPKATAELRVQIEAAEPLTEKAWLLAQLR